MFQVKLVKNGTDNGRIELHVTISCRYISYTVKTENKMAQNQAVFSKFLTYDEKSSFYST